MFSDFYSVSLISGCTIWYRAHENLNLDCTGPLRHSPNFDIMTLHFSMFITWCDIHCWDKDLLRWLKVVYVVCLLCNRAWVSHDGQRMCIEYHTDPRFIKQPSISDQMWYLWCTFDMLVTPHSIASFPSCNRNCFLSVCVQDAMDQVQGSSSQACPFPTSQRGFFHSWNIRCTLYFLHDLLFFMFVSPDQSDPLIVSLVGSVSG